MIEKVKPDWTQFLTKKEIIVVEKICAKIREKFEVVSFTLFGSKARGDFREYSDIDILILLKDSVDFYVRDELMDIASDFMISDLIDINTVTFNYKDWNESYDFGLKKNIEKDGVPIDC